MSNTKIRDTDYLFLTTMLRARESKMLTDERLARLLDAQDFDEAAKLISESGYADLSGKTMPAIDAVLNEHRAETFHELERFQQAVMLLNVFRFKYDYHNVKVLVKAMRANTDGSPLLSDAGRVPPQKLIEAFITGDRLSLPKAMADAISKAVGILSRTFDPQLSDIEVDRHYYEELSELAKQIGNDFITSYVRLLIDNANLRTVVRTLRMRKDQSFIQNFLIEGGTYRTDLFSKLSPSGEELKDIFESSALSTAVQLGQSAIDGGSLTAFERECDDAVTRYLRKANLTSFGAEPVITYIAALEWEIMSIRMILTGKLSGIAPDVIRERLRISYV